MLRTWQVLRSAGQRLLLYRLTIYLSRISFKSSPYLVTIKIQMPYITSSFTRRLWAKRRVATDITTSSIHSDWKTLSWFIFSNDTSMPKVFSNLAYINGNFSDITCGSDHLTSSVLPHSTTTTSTTSAAIKERSLPTANAYPTDSIAQHPQGYISRYFLNSYDDTCVLQMSALKAAIQLTPTMQRNSRQQYRAHFQNAQQPTRQS